MTQDDDLLSFRLYYPKDEANKMLGVRLRYREVEITATFMEGQDADLLAAVSSFPKVLEMAHEERAIQEEVRSMGTELDELLGDSE